jgi:hypothetical protein
MPTVSERRAIRALAPGWRAVRVGVLGGASMLLATGAHLVGGGALPSPGLVVVSALLLGLVAVPLTMRRCRLPLVVGVLGVEQLALHAVLSAATTDPLGCLPAVAHHATTGGCPPVAGTAGHGFVADPAAAWPMTSAHVAAVLVTAWLLVRGEAVLWRLTDELARAGWPARPGLRSATAPLLVSRPTVAGGRRPAAPLPARGPPVSV